MRFELYADPVFQYPTPAFTTSVGIVPCQISFRHALVGAEPLTTGRSKSQRALRVMPRLRRAFSFAAVALHLGAMQPRCNVLHPLLCKHGFPEGSGFVFLYAYDFV